MVERLLLTPEICGSNPNIGKISSINRTFKTLRKDKKGGWVWPVFKKEIRDDSNHLLRSNNRLTIKWS